MPAIELRDVIVEHQLLDASARSLKRRLLRGLTPTGGEVVPGRRRTSVRALDNVSLAVGDGEKVAVLGHNGAGKSTLLRVMAGVYEPSHGAVDVQGSVATLFDIVLGIDRDVSGLENIYLRGAILGLARDEIDARIDDILAFSELGPFIGMPVRTYSGGMKLRLAFAIATSIEPEILLLDEWIGVGDKAFVERAQDRLAALVGRTRILVVATHRLALARKLCDRAVVLRKGKIVADGAVADIVDRYERQTDRRAAAGARRNRGDIDPCARGGGESIVVVVKRIGGAEAENRPPLAGLAMMSDPSGSTDGFVRDIYPMTDGQGAVLICEAAEEAEIRRRVQGLRFLQDERFTVDVYPVSTARDGAKPATR